MILVTGGTGLAGTHLLQLLCRESNRVRALYSEKRELEKAKAAFCYFSQDAAALFANIEWIEADILDIIALRKSFKGVTKVYHCAEMVSFSAKEYRRMQKINVEGTANIVNICIAEEVKKLCYLSSVSALGKAVGQAFVTETCEWDPAEKHSGYALTKYDAEMEVWRGSQEGLKVVIVNPGVIIGGGFWDRGCGLFFSKVAKGLPFFTFGKAGFVSAADVAKAMFLLMEHKVSEERYILVSDNLSFKTFLTLVALSLNKKPPHIRLRKWMLILMRYFNEFAGFFLKRQNMITKDVVRASAAECLFSSDKIVKGATFRFDSLEETIAEVGAMYLKEQGDL